MQNLREAWFLLDQGANGGAGMDYITALSALTQYLTIDNFIPVLKGSKIQVDTESEPMEMVSGPLPSLNPSVPGSEKGSGSLIVPILGYAPTGDDGETIVYSPFEKAMQILCGFGTVGTTGSGTESGHEQVVLTPGLWNSSGLLLRVSGPRPNLNVLQDCLYNLLADCEIDIAVNKYAKATFKLTGAALSEQDVATATPFGSGNSPVTMAYPMDASKAPSFKSATILLAGVAHNVISAKFTIGGAISSYTDVAEPNGVGISEATDRKITTSFKIYADPAADDYTTHPRKNLREGSVDTLNVTFGSKNAKQSYMSGNHKIKKVSESDEGGAATFDVEGEFLMNDFTLTRGVTAE